MKLHFEIVFKLLQNNINDQRYCNCTIYSAYLSSFPIVTNHDVGVLIKNMKPKACVLDPIPAYMFKEYVLQIAPPVRAIINASLFTGTVPNKLKESVITPIYKRKQLPR